MSKRIPLTHGRKLRQAPSAKEIERRKLVAAEILRDREMTPPLEVSTAELVHRARREADEQYG